MDIDCFFGEEEEERVEELTWESLAGPESPHALSPEASQPAEKEDDPASPAQTPAPAPSPTPASPATPTPASPPASPPAPAPPAASTPTPPTEAQPPAKPSPVPASPSPTPPTAAPPAASAHTNEDAPATSTEYNNLQKHVRELEIAVAAAGAKTTISRAHVPMAEGKLVPAPVTKRALNAEELEKRLRQDPSITRGELANAPVTRKRKKDESDALAALVRLPDRTRLVKRTRRRTGSVVSSSSSIPGNADLPIDVASNSPKPGPEMTIPARVIEAAKEVIAHNPSGEPFWWKGKWCVNRDLRKIAQKHGVSHASVNNKVRELRQNNPLNVVQGILEGIDLFNTKFDSEGIHMRLVEGDPNQELKFEVGGLPIKIKQKEITSVWPCSRGDRWFTGGAIDFLVSQAIVRSVKHIDFATTIAASSVEALRRVCEGGRTTLVPIHKPASGEVAGEHNHWALAVVCAKEREVLLVDSLSSSFAYEKALFRAVLHGVSNRGRGWRFSEVFLPGSPIQTDDSNCGAWVCLFIFALVKGTTHADRAPSTMADIIASACEVGNDIKIGAVRKYLACKAMKRNSLDVAKRDGDGTDEEFCGDPP